MRKILAIIPARGGSKGLPGKNIKSLLGKPLIGYSIEAIRASKYDIDIVISTDSQEIAKVGADYDIETIMRPAALASDTSLVIDAVKYTITELENKGIHYDTLLLIEPTSPMRDSADIDEVIDLLFCSNDYDSVTTFSLLEHPITRLWKIENNAPSVYIEGADPFRRRQDQEYAYYINGLVYAFNIKMLKDNNYQSLFTKKMGAIITNKQVVDIDTKYDFFLAEQLIRNKRNQ